ncbi:MAG: septum formation inhibitor Maf [Lachnospiraceae bacterium]|nr:septum formation inhibitor Maf [Lachnospiraceae bacterium]
MKWHFILASASPRRRELLRQIGAEFQVLPAKGEEVITSTEPAQVVLELSMQKAKETAEHVRKFGTKGIKEEGCFLPEEEKRKSEKFLILGADTVVALEGEILGKPKDQADAVRMLQRLSGSTHSVFTGVTLILQKPESEEMISFFEETKVFMHKITDREIEAYVKTGEPLDKAGAYGIQGKGAVYIEKIAGDYNNVVGLPIARIYQELRKSGIEIL